MADRTVDEANARGNVICAELREHLKQYPDAMICVVIGIRTDDPDVWCIAGGSTTNPQNSARLLLVGLQSANLHAMEAQGNG